MITSQQALQIILDNTVDFGEEEIPFIDSLGRVLKEDIVADRNFPPFNRVSMDGIAVQYSVFERGVREFSVENVQAAGAEQLEMKNAESCLEVMTGAVLPNNTDSVIPYEQVSIERGIAKVNLDEIKFQQNVHLKGKDRKEGDVLIQKNTVISAAEIGVLATVGKTKVKVAKLPKVMIVST
ncbi:MAG: molybdopterin molybdenumtransferase MoeA, partial [Flavobacteriaceae bacterium]|nr:molybdopterin molybdenumtransferase MoeA [Flavobacteriaceae bacterium]